MPRLDEARKALAAKDLPTCGAAMWAPGIACTRQAGHDGRHECIEDEHATCVDVAHLRAALAAVDEAALENARLRERIERAEAALATLTAEAAELNATLLNERGEGEPPGPGWERNDFDREAVGIAWYRIAYSDGRPASPDSKDYDRVLWVYRAELPDVGWRWEIENVAEALLACWGAP